MNPADWQKLKMMAGKKHFYCEHFKLEVGSQASFCSSRTRSGDGFLHGLPRSISWCKDGWHVAWLQLPPLQRGKPSTKPATPSQVGSAPAMTSGLTSKHTRMWWIYVDLRMWTELALQWLMMVDDGCKLIVNKSWSKMVENGSKRLKFTANDQLMIDD